MPKRSRKGHYIGRYMAKANEELKAEMYKVEAAQVAAWEAMVAAVNEQAIRKSENNYLLLSERIKVLGSIIVSLCLIGAGVYCGIIGQPWLGVALGTSGAVAGIMSGLIKRI